ncbi:MAG: TonB-dependent receptor [Gammaproteobacteria bacterium]|nr:TonB-dependent receptor [Gammaproteobacteria bacterium]
MKYFSLSLTLLFSVICNANNQKDSVDNEITIVVTAERLPQDISEVQNNISVLTNTELKQISAEHFNELDIAFPNTWISKGNGQEHLTAIRSPVFTGPGSCAEFLMMENNVPLRAKGFCNVNQLFDSYMSQATQVELLRGTHSAFYGSDAVHGVINIITRELSPELSNSNFIKATSGDFGYWQLDSLWKNESVAAKTSLTKDSGVKQASGYDQQKAQLEWLTALSEWQAHTTITLSNLNQETAGYLQAGENAYELDENRFSNPFPEAYREAKSLRIQTEMSNIHSSQHNDNYLWKIIPYFRYNDMDFLMHFLPGQPTEQNGHTSIGIIANYSGLLSQLQSHTQSETETETQKLSTLNWQIGLDSEFNQAFLKQFQSSPTDSGIPFLDEVLPTGKQYDFKVDSQYLAAQASLHFESSNQQKVSGGIRLDYLNYDYNNRMLDGRTQDDGSACGFGGCRYTRPADRSDSFKTPSAFATYRFLNESESTAYLKLDRGYRAPQATELYRLQNGQQTSELEAQKVSSAELSFKWQKSLNQQMVTLFFMDKSNVIYQNTDREWVYNATTEHKGIEWNGQFEINRNWLIKSHFTFAKHVYTNNSQLTTNNINGNDIDTAPRRIAGAILHWQPNDDFQLGFGLRYIGDYYLNPENTEQYEGHTLLNLNGQWSIGRQANLSFKILNALDENYADRADFAFGEHRYFVGEPRRAYISVMMGY